MPVVRTLRVRVDRVQFSAARQMDLQLKPETKEKLIFGAVCFVLVFLVYGVSLFGDFVFDDRGIVEHFSLLGNLGLLDKVIALPYWTEAAGLYRPITLLSYTLNFAFFDFSPFWFHFVNLALYAAIGFLLYLLVEKLFNKKMLACLAAILFLVLPIHSEAVANITGRSELLALFFSLLCFLELIKVSAKKYWLAGLWLFLAIGSKETAIAALPLAGLIIYIQERGDTSLREESPRSGESKETPYSVRTHLAQHLAQAVWLLTGALTYFALRFAVLGSQYFLHVETSMVENPLKFVSVGPRIFTALQVLWLYTEKSFWPPHLCSDYSYNQIPVAQTFFNPYTLLGSAVLIWLVGIKHTKQCVKKFFHPDTYGGLKKILSSCRRMIQRPVRFRHFGAIFCILIKLCKTRKWKSTQL
jgi:hypothetical protein